MSVYVDNLFGNPSWGRWTGGGHMTADSLDELHSFAQSIGLKRSWFQNTSGKPMPHYDLTRAKRLAALEAGAIPVGPRDQAALALRLGGSVLQQWALDRIAALEVGDSRPPITAPGFPPDPCEPSTRSLAERVGLPENHVSLHRRARQTVDAAPSPQRDERSPGPTCRVCKGTGSRVVRAGHCGTRLVRCKFCKGTGARSAQGAVGGEADA